MRSIVFRRRGALLLSLGLAAGAAGGVILRSPRAGAEVKAEGGVILFPAKEIAEAFAKGRMVHSAADCKIMAGHRDAPGIPEVHDSDTDVFYVLAGAATFVVGGKVIEPRAESPGETRGSRIEGGRSLPLKKGDAILIPRGVPHWFSAVEDPVDYFVVKVVAPGKGAR